MSKSNYGEGASPRDKKAFAKYLAEDEELVLATGLGSNFVRHRFVYYMLWPGGIGFIASLIYWYFMQRPQGADPLSDKSLAYALLTGLVVAIVLALLKTIWLYNANRYLLTTRRVIVKNGFFAVKLTSALFDKVTHIEVEQSFLDRIIMKHGTIIINTAGANKDEIKIKFIDYPIEFKNLLERLINRERERFSGSSNVVTLEGEVVEGSR